MSKTKKNGSVHYEILFIIPNQFTQEEARGINKQVQKMITDHKGEVTYAEEWGKKKLAYPIAHNSHGYYYLIEFDVLGEQMQKMDRWLKMNRDILRYQIVKTKKRTQEEKEQENEKRAQAKHKKEVDEEKREQELKQEKEEKKEKKDRGKDDKTDLKDLDKKLDDILDSHDLL